MFYTADLKNIYRFRFSQFIKIGFMIINIHIIVRILNLMVFQAFEYSAQLSIGAEIVLEVGAALIYCG